MDPESSDEELANMLVRVHETSPEFRQVAADNAPRLHATLLADSARRRMPLAVLLMGAGMAMSLLATGSLLLWGGRAVAGIGSALLIDYVLKRRRAQSA